MTATDAGTRRTRRDATRNQKLIIDAARQVLAEHGIDARMDAIAAQAGVGIGTVYRHFPNKQALIDELVRLIHDELTTAAQTALARGDGTGLETFLHALGQSFADHHGYADALMAQGRTDGADALRTLIGRLLEDAQQHGRISSVLTIGDVLTTAWALRGIVEATAGVAPNAWQRHLDIVLVGMRTKLPSGLRSGLTRHQLARIANRHTT